MNYLVPMLCRVMYAAGDHVDSDIIHFACFGYWFGQQLFPVHAFTTDEAEKIQDRLALYKSQIIHFRSEILEGTREEYLRELCDKYPPLEGAVHVVNRDGTLNCSLFVSNIK